MQATTTTHRASAPALAWPALLAALALAACGGPAAAPDGQAIEVTVRPPAVALPTGGEQPFSAAVTGTASTAVTWSVQEGTPGGTVSAAGLYGAPAVAGTFHVVAASVADPSVRGTATVTVTGPAACGTPIRFAVIGDFGFAGPGGGEAAVAALVKGWNPDFVVTVGDNNYEQGQASTIDANIGQFYAGFIAPYHGSFGPGAAVNAFFPALGNHDWLNPAAGGATDCQPYLDYFSGLPGNRRYYDFVKGPVHFFVLDSDPHEPDGITSGSTQGRWLQAGLAASTARFNVVTLHHAPFSSGSTHGSTTASQWPYAAWGADAVLAGHEHNYERLTVDGIPYVVNGLGGDFTYAFGRALAQSQVRFNADYGAQLVEADGARLTMQFIRLGGAVVDTVTVTNPAPCP
jgi:hypothetical protein